MEYLLHFNLSYVIIANCETRCSSVLESLTANIRLSLSKLRNLSEEANERSKNI